MRSILGPIFDESAIQFYLVFNKRLKVFHYVLDESGTVAGPVLLPAKARPHPGRQAHRLCVLQGSSAGPENPDRRVRRQHAGEQLFRRTVRPAARTTSSRAKRCAMRSLRSARSSKGEIDRFGGVAGRQHPVHDRAVSAVQRRERLEPDRRLRGEETKAAGLLSLLRHRRQIRWYGAAEARQERPVAQIPKSGNRFSDKIMRNKVKNGLGRRRHRARRAPAWRSERHRRGDDARARPPSRPGARRGGLAHAPGAAARQYRARDLARAARRASRALRRRGPAAARLRTDDRGACGLWRDAPRGAVPAVARARSARGGA